MYCAKEEGRVTHRLCKPAMEGKLYDRWAFELDLSRAIRADKLEVRYQPNAAGHPNRSLSFQACRSDP